MVERNHKPDIRNNNKTPTRRYQSHASQFDEFFFIIIEFEFFLILKYKYEVSNMDICIHHELVSNVENY